MDELGPEGNVPDLASGSGIRRPIWLKMFTLKGLVPKELER